MKRTINVLMLFFLFLIGEKVRAQELALVIPLIPNEASKAIFGEIPLNHFRGMPGNGNPI